MSTAVPDRPLLGLLLRLLAQRWNAEVDAALTEAGFDDLRPAHANVFALVPDAGITVTALAERAGVRKQSMAQTVEELERLGYLERARNPRDGRSRLVRLTPRGEGVRPVGRRAGAAIEAAWAARVGEGELERVRDGLRALLEAGSGELTPRGSSTRAR